MLGWLSSWVWDEEEEKEPWDKKTMERKYILTEQIRKSHMALKSVEKPNDEAKIRDPQIEQITPTKAVIKMNTEFTEIQMKEVDENDNNGD